MILYKQKETLNLFSKYTHIHLFETTYQNKNKQTQIFKPLTFI